MYIVFVQLHFSHLEERNSYDYAHNYGDVVINDTFRFVVTALDKKNEKRILYCYTAAKSLYFRGYHFSWIELKWFHSWV